MRGEVSGAVRINGEMDRSERETGEEDHQGEWAREEQEVGILSTKMGYRLIEYR
jgi:hypothetical protein